VNGTFVGDTSPTVCGRVSHAQVLHHVVEAYSERREDFGLANELRRALVAIALYFLALGYWPTGDAIMHIGSHVYCGLERATGHAYTEVLATSGGANKKFPD
jgi:hypothetical protein